MADLPMIFNGDMVRAILDGRKTQTRRVMKPQLGDIAHAFQFMPGQWRFIGHDGRRRHQVCSIPYASGDRIWVRETWTKTQHDKTVYRADARDASGLRWTSIQPGDPDGEVIWRPSIHMPRWASRLTLTITDVRVQRVQEISEADAISEGIEKVGCGAAFVQMQDASVYSTPRGCFATLWDGIYAKRGIGWVANPWVCALTFTVHHCNIDKMEAA